MGPFGKNQCVLIHLAAGTIWRRSGSHLGAPDARVVLNEAEEWRAGGFLEELPSTESLKNNASHIADEIRSLAHDATTPINGRGYRSFVMFSPTWCPNVGFPLGRLIYDVERQAATP